MSNHKKEEKEDIFMERKVVTIIVWMFEENTARSRNDVYPDQRFSCVLACLAKRSSLSSSFHWKYWLPTRSRLQMWEKIWVSSARISLRQIDLSSPPRTSFVYPEKKLRLEWGTTNQSDPSLFSWEEMRNKPPLLGKDSTITCFYRRKSLFFHVSYVSM